MKALNKTAYAVGFCLGIGAIAGLAGLLVWSAIWLAIHQPEVEMILVILVLYVAQLSAHRAKVHRLNQRIDQLEHENEMLAQAHDALVRWG